MKNVIYSICIEKLHNASPNVVSPFIEIIRDEIDNYDYTTFSVVSNWGTDHEDYIHFRRDLTQFVNKFRKNLLSGIVPEFDYNLLMLLLKEQQELTTSEEHLIESIK
jgi:hypothetical protein